MEVQVLRDRPYVLLPLLDLATHQLVDLMDLLQARKGLGVDRHLLKA